jgi:hypothetical protein
MLKEGRWLLSAASDLESRMRQIATGFESELRLVHDSLIPTEALIDDIRAFEDLRCGTRLRIGCEALTGSWEALREGRADVVIAAGEGPAGGGYQAATVGSLDFAFCVAPTHPLTRLGRRCSAATCWSTTPSWWATARARCPTAPSAAGGAAAHHGAVDVRQDRLPGGGAGPRLPAARVHRGELARGTLVELQTEEPRAPEAFWLAWKTGAQGQALQWWVKQLNRHAGAGAAAAFVLVRRGVARRGGPLSAPRAACPAPGPETPTGLAPRSARRSI